MDVHQPTTHQPSPPRSAGTYVRRVVDWFTRCTQEACSVVALASPDDPVWAVIWCGAVMEWLFVSHSWSGVSDYIPLFERDGVRGATSLPQLQHVVRQHAWMLRKVRHHVRYSTRRNRARVLMATCTTDSAGSVHRCHGSLRVAFRGHWPRKPRDAQTTATPGGWASRRSRS